MKLSDYEFVEVAGIDSEKDCNGEIIGYNPKDKYKKKETLKLNAYGNLTFCNFKIPKHSNKSGVYSLFETDNDSPLYIGQAINFDKRWGRTNYAHISPRNCYVGGQSTNCHINHYIYKKIKEGAHLKLYFYETPYYKRIEDELIRKYKPELNVQKNKI